MTGPLVSNNPIDLMVLTVYALSLIALTFFAGRSRSNEEYLANGRTTGFKLFLASTVATWVGSGAIVGVSSAGFVSGISYGLSVLIINCAVMLLFAYLAPRIKNFGDTRKAFTVGQYLGANFGRTVQLSFSLCYLGIVVIWIASQLLAAGNLLAIVASTSILNGIFIAFGITIIYSSIGGLKSDIITDALQFWVMLAAFVLMVPIVWFRVDGFAGLESLPSSAFDPYAFGGQVFLYASILLGMLYPLVDGCAWQRIYAADSAVTARRAFLLSWPLIGLFVGSATFIGLAARLMIPADTNPDQALFSVMQQALPPGVLGLGFAGIIAVVMSTVDSLIVAGTGALACDVLPSVGVHGVTVSRLRLYSLTLGILGVILAGYVSSVVELSLLAAYLSICFAPAMLSALFSWQVSKRFVELSIFGSILSFGLGWAYLGKSAFIPIVLVGFGIVAIGRLMRARVSRV